MDDADDELPGQLLQSKGTSHSKVDSKEGMEDAILDKGSQPFLKSESDFAVDKRTDSEMNADLSEGELSDSLLCDGVINMLRKILNTKQTREIVRKKTLKRPRNNDEPPDKLNNGDVPKAYSRCSVPYFLDVVKTTRKSQKKVQLVIGIGFAYLLDIDDSVVPRHFTQWVADKVCVEDELISINNKAITLNAESVYHVFGIPAGEIIISTSDDGGKEEFLALFGLSEVPPIKFFGNKIIKEEDLSDDQFIRCFMVVALATFLCPTSNTKPSTKYMGALLDVGQIKGLNWCKFTQTWLMQAIDKYQKDKLKQNKTTLTLGGCIYYLAVHCLDFIDFGPIQLQATMPRICVWKGNLIKLFSETLMGINGTYGACKVKNESETCYGQENHGWASTKRYSYLKSAIERTVGDTLDDKVKEDIYLSFQHYMKDEGPNTCSKVKNLILETLRIVTTATCASDKTLKIDSSGNQQNSPNNQHDSEATVKVNSDGEYEEEDEDLLSRKKRRVATKIQASAYHASPNNLAKETTLSQQSVGTVGSHSRHKLKLTGDEPAAVYDHQQDKSNNKGEGAVLKERPNEDCEDDCEEERKSKFNTQGQLKDEVDNTDNLKHATTGSTTSFDYMLGHEKLESSSFLQQEQGFTASPIPIFDFQNKCDQNSQQTLKTKQNKLNININEAFVEDEEQVLSDKAPSDWARYLDEARQKYFFYSDNIKTLRLFENHDDSGTEIKEPELWRPLGMLAEAYENKIQMAKNNGPSANTEQAENVQRDWARYLDESRQKYFFYTDDIPTLRLFENLDDNGTEIMEPELWRPLGMLSQEYKDKIQMAKNNGPPKSPDQGDNVESKVADRTSNNLNHTSSSKQKDFSVHCAQRPQSLRYTCETPRPLTAVRPDGSIIDLTSPNRNDAFEWSREQTCYSPRNKSNRFLSHKSSQKTKTDSPNHSIIGRRLFPDDYNHGYLPDGTEEEPITFNDNEPASPEVQILGERSLQQTCMNMLGNSDDHYNTRLLLGSTSTSIGKENVPTKRIVQPSRYLCSPYNNQDRGSIMEHEIELYNNLMILSRTEGFKGKWVVEIDNVRVSMEQLGNSFKDKGWVESYVINVFCRKLFRDNHPRTSQRHFFFHTGILSA